MKPTIITVRAIGVEFVRRALRPLIIIGLVLAVVLLAAGAWLTTQSMWWWLLEIILIAASLLFVAAMVVIRIILRIVDAPQSPVQRQAVRAFVDKMQRVTDSLQTPHIVIIYRIVRDTIRPRPSGNFVQTVVDDSKTLAPDFASLLKQFQ